MTYIIEGFRGAGRVRIGFVGMRSPHERVFAGLGGLGAVPKVSGGTGAPNDPFGGIGGATETVLKSLVKAGLKFASIKAENGLVNGEKYIYCQGSDKKFYKFHMTGTGFGKALPTDAAAIAWFNQVVNAATPKTTVPSTVTAPAITLPQITLPTVPGSRSVALPNAPMPGLLIPGGSGGDASSGKTMLLVGGLVAVGAVLLVLKKRGKAA